MDRVELIKTLLGELGLTKDLGSEFDNTAERMSKAYDETLSSVPWFSHDMFELKPNSICKGATELIKVFTELGIATTFESDSKSSVVVKNIPFYSTCEHHMMPFFGTATVSYVPNGRVIGLSKIPRLVEFLSRHIQLQERLTQEIALSIKLLTNAKAVTVELNDVRHMCVEMRGVKECNAMTDTAVSIQ